MHVRKHMPNKLRACRGGGGRTPWPNKSFNSCRCGWASKDASKPNTCLWFVGQKMAEEAGYDSKDVCCSLRQGQHEEGAEVRVQTTCQKSLHACYLGGRLLLVGTYSSTSEATFKKPTDITDGYVPVHCMCCSHRDPLRWLPVSLSSSMV